MEQKPGYKTTEFWLSLAAIILGAVMASGLIPEGHVANKIIGCAVAVLAALGYTASRASVKRGGTGLLLVLVLAGSMLSACSPQAQQLATCIAGRTASRCLPQCALCVKDVVSECKAQAGASVDAPAACQGR